MAASSTPTAGEAARQRAAEFLLRRHHFIWPEALPWLLAIAAFFAFPDRMTIGTQVLIMIMFALSLDLILGYAGIITLGHAAFFGIGAYTVGLGLARLGWSEPISGLIAAGLVAAFAGGDGSDAPAVAGRADELFGLRQLMPAGGRFLRQVGIGFGEVAGQPHEGEVPADPDGARAMARTATSSRCMR